MSTHRTTTNPLALLLGCLLASSSQAAESPTTFTLSSPDIKAESHLTNKQVFNDFGCSGDNISPALHWNGAPKGTQSYALTVYDPDAPTGSGWWHWVVFNIPAKSNALPAHIQADGKGLPDGAIQSLTDFGPPGFGGACPPWEINPTATSSPCMRLKFPHWIYPPAACPPWSAS